jgi:hypothetical protein
MQRQRESTWRRCAPLRPWQFWQRRRLAPCEWFGRASCKPYPANQRIARLSCASHINRETDCNLWIDPRPAETICRIDAPHFSTQPGKVQNLIDACKNVVVGDKLAERAGHQKLGLTAQLFAHRLIPSTPSHRLQNRSATTFSTAPRGIFATPTPSPGEWRLSAPHVCRR